MDQRRGRRQSQQITNWRSRKGSKQSTKPTTYCFREHSTLLGKPARYGYRDLGASSSLVDRLEAKGGRYQRTGRKEKRKRPTHPREKRRVWGRHGGSLDCGRVASLITREVGENAF
jgi:hypothetical protein